ncbi:MAG: hypothetical protein IH585_16055 [Anaerolineaceae bacterium]|nr:hypothetical protein [Anaerolineaceae bacterium]
MKQLLRILIFFSLLISFLLPVIPAIAQNTPGMEPFWLPADPASKPSSPPKTEIKNIDTHTLDVTLTFSGVWAQAQTGDGQSYTRLWHEEYSSYREPGQPALPGVTFNILIPQGAQVEVIQQKASSHTISLPRQGLPSKIIPAQRQASKSEPPPPWTPPDPARYASLSLQPQHWYEVNDTFQMRDYTILPLWVNPVRYRPANGEIELLEKIELRLTWPESSAAVLDAAVVSDSPSFDRLVSQIVINPPPQATMDTTKSGEGYLIITPEEFVEQLKPFVSMKQTQGYSVDVTLVREIPGFDGLAGSEENNILAIQNYIRSLDPPPVYLLLVGDTNLIPAPNGEVLGQKTDLYYSTLEPLDYIPDIHVGRLPARTAQNVSNLVNKLTSYTSNGFLDWQIDSAFIATCDSTYFTTAEYSHNTVIQNYTQPLNYPTYFPETDSFLGGDRLYCKTYSELISLPIIKNSINNGRGIITFSGHGTMNGWYDGLIVISRDDIPIIAPNNISSVVASFACSTNDFGNNDVRFSSVFSETWMLQENKGAIAFLGSAGLTQWGQDDVLERAFYDSLFEDPLTTTPLREALFQGLTVVEANYPGTGSYQAKYYWETYNLLGDPSQKLWLYPDSEYYFIAKAPIRQDEGLITNVVQYPVTITNYGFTDEFIATVDPTEWLTETSEIGVIESKTAETFWITVHIPYDASPAQFDQAQVTISSSNSTQATSFTFTTTALETFFTRLPVIMK